jgi:hypothetical protein
MWFWSVFQQGTNPSHRKFAFNFFSLSSQSSGSSGTLERYRWRGWVRLLAGKAVWDGKSFEEGNSSMKYFGMILVLK